MSDPQLQPNFNQVITDLMAWWEAAGADGLLTGGLAASVLGRPRLTRDVDATVLVPQEKWSDFLNCSLQFNFIPRVDDPLAFAARARILLLKHRPTGLDVDVSFGALPFEYEMLNRVRYVEIAGTSVPFASAEDLIVMKVMANRPRDISDVEGLVIANPNLDRTVIDFWLNQFAALLDDPALLTRGRALLDREQTPGTDQEPGY